MVLHERMALAAAVAGLTLACGGCDARGGAVHAVDASADAREPVRVSCDGSAEDIAFAAVRAGGGAVEQGAEVLSRNGMFAALTGSCEFSCGTWEGEIYRKQFTPAEANDLLRDFEVERIAERDGVHGDAGADAPATILAFGGHQIVVHGCHPGSGCPDWLSDLQSRASRYYTSCAELGEPVDTPVRYTLMALEDGMYLDYEWQDWPLSVPAASVATEEWGEAYDAAAAVHVATGTDAGSLRALRRRLRAGELGAVPMRHVPIAAGGRTYLLYVADAHPLEREDGLIPFPFRPAQASE